MPLTWSVPTGLRRTAEALYLAFETAVGCFTKRDAHMYDLLTLYRPLAAGTPALGNGGVQRPDPCDSRISGARLVRMNSLYPGGGSAVQALQATASEQQHCSMAQDCSAESEDGASCPASIVGGGSTQVRPISSLQHRWVGACALTARAAPGVSNTLMTH